VADPKVRILFCRGTFFTNLTLEMAAVAANDAAHRYGSQLKFRTYRFSRSWFYKSKRFMLHRCIFLRHPLYLTVERIDSLRWLYPLSRDAPSPPPSRRRPKRSSRTPRRGTSISKQTLKRFVTRNRIKCPSRSMKALKTSQVSQKNKDVSQFLKPKRDRLLLGCYFFYNSV